MDLLAALCPTISVCFDFKIGTFLNASRNLLFGVVLGVLYVHKSQLSGRFQNRTKPGNLVKIVRFANRTKPNFVLIEFVLSGDLLYQNFL